MSTYDRLPELISRKMALKVSVMPILRRLREYGKPVSTTIFRQRTIWVLPVAKRKPLFLRNWKTSSVTAPRKISAVRLPDGLFRLR